MRIVITHPIIQDSMPTNSCFFCGYPVNRLGITCINETAQDKVLGLVCITCLQRAPVDLQAELAEKVSRLRAQSAVLRTQADRLLAQAEWLERLAQQPLALPTAVALESIPL
jgi:hypothetical protein